MHRGQNRGKQKSKLIKNVTLAKIEWKYRNFVDIREEFTNIVEIGGICNIHHWLMPLVIIHSDPGRI